MSETKPAGNYIGQAWLVIALGLFFGVSLAWVEMALGGKIAANRKNETYQVVPQLVPGADVAKTTEVLLTGVDGQQCRVLRAANSQGEHLGWVIPTGGQGFGDRIDLLLGTDVDLEKITGIYVLNQKETPGLGDYITAEYFRERFKDKPTDEPLVVVKAEPKDPHEVLALTGATISSASVTGIVNRALANYRDAILKVPETP